MRSPSAWVASWLLAPPATIGTFSAAMLSGVRIAPSAQGLSTSAATRHDRVGRDRGAAGFARERLGLGAVDVGDGEPRALRRRVAGKAGGDAARALDGDVEAGEIVLAELALHRGLDAEEDAVAGIGPGIAPCPAAGDRQAGNVARLLRDLDQVGDADPDILGGDIGAARAPRSPCHRRRASRGVLVRASSARITALPPPIGSPAMAFLKLIPRERRSASATASPVLA